MLLIDYVHHFMIFLLNLLIELLNSVPPSSIFFRSWRGEGPT